MQLIITTGEPAGIGPDITILTLLHLASCERYKKLYFNQKNTKTNSKKIGKICVIGDANELNRRAALLGCGASWSSLIGNEEQICIEHIDLAASCVPGKLNHENAKYVLFMLDKAISLCLRPNSKGLLCAMVTGPIQKSLLTSYAGSIFTGHTEYLAKATKTEKVVMMLVGKVNILQPQLAINQTRKVVLAKNQLMLRVALATTHLPISKIAQSISATAILATLRIIHYELNIRFKVKNPRILVCGLNPHAGENGTIGCEEIEMIIPAIEQAAREGINVRGPFPADTLFQPKYLKAGDCVLAMYHDQGLVPLKYATFGHGVNVTLGLPFVRTSVDHGTALLLAGTKKVNYSSMLEAILLARELQTGN